MALTNFSSKAWLLDGPIHSIPGILHYNENQLAYLMLEQGSFSDARFARLLSEHSITSNTHDSTGDTAESVFPLQLFSVSCDNIQRFHIPWYYFGAGAKMVIDQQALRFSFVKPQNTVEPTYYSESFMEWRGGAGQEEINIPEGKNSGKRWKELLS